MGITHIVLQNDRRAGSALLRTRAVVQSDEVDVSALEFQSGFQLRTSVWICKKPAVPPRQRASVKV